MVPPHGPSGAAAAPGDARKHITLCSLETIPANGSARVFPLKLWAEAVANGHSHPELWAVPISQRAQRPCPLDIPSAGGVGYVNWAPFTYVGGNVNGALFTYVGGRAVLSISRPGVKY